MRCFAPVGNSMLIEAGFKISFQCPNWTPMLLQLNVHASRISDLRSPDVIKSDPPVPMRFYHDLFGNMVTRLDAPPGLITFYNQFEVFDTGRLEDVPSYNDLTPISALPDDVLLYLVSS